MTRLTRRSFLKTAGTATLASGIPVSGAFGARRDTRPNVLIFITDDQGFGDLGVHGNDMIRTPNLDRFAENSVEFSQFNVCPVCAPTRACLMTGRYNYRTRAIDTWKGRAMMDPDELMTYI